MRVSCSKAVCQSVSLQSVSVHHTLLLRRDIVKHSTTQLSLAGIAPDSIVVEAKFRTV